MTIAIFLYIEGAISNTPMQSIFTFAEKHGVCTTVNRLMGSMLSDRIVQSLAAWLQREREGKKYDVRRGEFHLAPCVHS